MQRKTGKTPAVFISYETNSLSREKIPNTEF